MNNAADPDEETHADESGIASFIFGEQIISVAPVVSLVMNGAISYYTLAPDYVGSARREFDLAVASPVKNPVSQLIASSDRVNEELFIAEIDASEGRPRGGRDMRLVSTLLTRADLAHLKTRRVVVGKRHAIDPGMVQPAKAILFPNLGKALAACAVLAFGLTMFCVWNNRGRESFLLSSGAFFGFCTLGITLAAIRFDARRRAVSHIS